MTRDALAGLLPADLSDVLLSRSLPPQRSFGGHGQGKHNSARSGQGLEFRDQRAYSPGDDLRMLDWRAVARRDRLVLRQTEAEVARALVLVIDAGGGMGYGGGTTRKFHVARGLAAGLAWLAANQGDPIGYALGQNGRLSGHTARPRRGRERLNALAEELIETEPVGHCPWLGMLSNVRTLAPRGSVVVVLSDFLDPDGLDLPERSPERSGDLELRQNLGQLRVLGHTVVLVQLLHRDELEFPWRGRTTTTFTDLWGRRVARTATPASLREGYLDQLTAHLAWWDEAAQRDGLALVRGITDDSIASTFLSILDRLATAGRIPRSFG